MRRDMLDTIDKLRLAQPRNRDLMAVCKELERRLFAELAPPPLPKNSLLAWRRARKPIAKSYRKKRS